MKRTIRIIAAAIMGIALLSSCTKEPQQGQVIFTLNEDFDISEVTKASVSSYTSLPKASDFTLSIKDAYSTIWTGKLQDWDPEFRLEAGEYTAIASYGTEGEEGYDKPLFQGEQNFVVNGRETSTVSINVSLANCIIRASFEEGFKGYFPQGSVYVTTAAGNGFLFNYKTNKAAFVDPSKITVDISITSQGGVDRSVSKEYAGLKPATCYTMYFGTSGVGEPTFTITFNDSVETVDLGTITLNK